MYMASWSGTSESIFSRFPYTERECEPICLRVWRTALRNRFKSLSGPRSCRSVLLVAKREGLQHRVWHKLRFNPSIRETEGGDQD